MWPTKILEKIGPIIFKDDKPKEHYIMYIKSILKPKWFSELSNASTLFDFRDYAEDTWASIQKSFQIDSSLSVPIDSLLKSLKVSQDTTKRKNLTIAFLEENAYSLRSQIHIKILPESFIGFCIDNELETFFKHARGIGRFRPLLKAPLESLEAVIKEMEALGRNITVDHLQTFAGNLGLTTLWPVLAMWASNERGDIEDMFLHPPLPRIFGSPSCLRNAIEKTTSPEKTARRARTSLDIKRSVLSGLGHLAWLDGSEWRIEAHANACLVAPLPGMPHRMLWCLRPDTLQASIVSLDPFNIIAEFDLPVDEIAGEPNWIDCQRDAEGSLVLLWGQINALTGNLQTQNMVAFDEEFAIGKEFTMLDQISDLPQRRTIGTRVDWRDHGNLLSIHHTISDGLADNGERSWTHAYEVVFGSHLLMTFSTTARPIESIYGSPHDVFLLSPLSAKNAIQHWILDETYKLKESSEVPKNPAGHWTSFCVI
jgi:hypothetical protein